MLVGVGGFAGSVARYVLGGWVADRYGPAFPLHTLVINVTGSFALGLFMTLSLWFPWSSRLRLLVAIGFLGGYTTFSTYEYESLKLIEQGSFTPALLNLFGSLALGLVGVWLGLVVGRMIIRG